MGEDKSLMPFKGCDSLIEYQYKKLSKIFSKVYISAKTNKFNFNADILLDKSQVVYSPMVGLESILSNIKDEKVFIVTVDVPLIKLDTFRILCEKSENFAITIAKDNEYTHNLCGIFSIKLLCLIENLLENNIHAINALIQKSSSSQAIYFDQSEQFININTKDEYNKFLL